MARKDPLVAFRDRDTGQLDGMQTNWLNWVYDERTAGDILTDWLAHDESGGISREAFIAESLQCGEELTYDDLIKIIAGEQGVGSRLALHLSMRLPEKVTSRRVWLNRCDRTRREQPEHIKDISYALFDDKKQSAIGEKLNALLTRLRQESEATDSTPEAEIITKSTTPLYEYLMTRINGLLRARGVEADGEQLSQMLDNIASQVGVAIECIEFGIPLPPDIKAESLGHRLAELVSAGDPGAFDQVMTLSKQSFVETSIPAKTTYGDVIKFIREHTGQDRKSFAHAIGYSSADVLRGVESNRVGSMLNSQLGKFLTAVDLSQENAKSLTEATVRIRHASGQKSRDFQTLTPGSYITFLRSEAGKNQESLAAELGIQPKRLSSIERDESGMRLATIARLAEVFDLTDEDLVNIVIPQQPIDSIGGCLEFYRTIRGKYLRDLETALDVSEGTARRWERNEEAPTAEQIGTLIHTLDIPLHKLGFYIKTNNPPDTLGGIIEFHRRRLGYTQESLAQSLGLIRDTVVHWENNHFLPSGDRVPALTETLGLSRQDLRQIIETNQPLDTRGGLIEFHRKRLGLSQEVLAELLETTPPRISLWENGKAFPNVSDIPKVIEHLGVSAAELPILINTQHPVTTPAGLIEMHRHKTGLDQRGLADLVGCSSKAISEWENGKQVPTKVTHISQMVNALDLQPSDLPILIRTQQPAYSLAGMIEMNRIHCGYTKAALAKYLRCDSPKVAEFERAERVPTEAQKNSLITAFSESNGEVVWFNVEEFEALWEEAQRQDVTEDKTAMVYQGRVQPVPTPNLADNI